MKSPRRLRLTLSLGAMLFLGGMLAASGEVQRGDAGPGLGSDAIEALLRHGPWPAAFERDPSSRVSGDPAAASLGRALFFDAGLSANGQVSCATCHQPDRGWSDARPRAKGLAAGARNTLSLLNVAGQRWFGWAGNGDSLWSRSILPLLDAKEMGASPAHLKARIAGNTPLDKAYREVFGADVRDHSDEAALANIGKALAAFQETIRTERSRFDDFRDALAHGDHEAARLYPDDARRGAALFVGRGKCNFCHLGPMFSNGEFSSIGLGYFTGPTSVDAGRYAGIQSVTASRFNRLGPHNDAINDPKAWATRHVEKRSSNFGEFRVPALRGVRLSAPYMHDGSKAGLVDVIRHYSEIDLERLHADGERILEPLRLSAEEVRDLVAFLETL